MWRHTTARRDLFLVALFVAACDSSSPSAPDVSLRDIGDPTWAFDSGIYDTGQDVGVDASDEPFDGGSDAAGLDVRTEDSGHGSPDASPEDAAIVDGGASDVGSTPLGPLASDLALTIDRDVDVTPTPINQLYLAEIATASAGDHIASFQKYFRSAAMNEALVDAARRGAQVTAIYQDDVDPSCESFLLPGDTINCDDLFHNSLLPHHKNMMISKADGSVRGVVGSYNPRVRSTSSPRTHTVLSFTVSDGQPVFDFYMGEAARLTGASTTQPETLTVPIASGGELHFTFHPHSSNPVLELLDNVTTCDSTLWMSYYGAGADSVGRPAFDRLAELFTNGCDVRVLLDEGNATIGQIALAARGVPARFPTFPAGSATLGHKIVRVDSAGETHLIQTSANLSSAHHNLLHNLTVYVRAPTLAIAGAIDTELLRYW